MHAWSRSIWDFILFRRNWWSSRVTGRLGTWVVQYVGVVRSSRRGSFGFGTPNHGCGLVEVDVQIWMNGGKALYVSTPSSLDRCNCSRWLDYVMNWNRWPRAVLDLLSVAHVWWGRSLASQQSTLRVEGGKAIDDVEITTMNNPLITISPSGVRVRMCECECMHAPSRHHGTVFVAFQKSKLVGLDKSVSGPV
jgi:hypothetical protein